MQPELVRADATKSAAEAPTEDSTFNEWAVSGRQWRCELIELTYFFVLPMGRLACSIWLRRY